MNINISDAKVCKTKGCDGQVQGVLCVFIAVPLLQLLVSLLHSSPCSPSCSPHQFLWPCTAPDMLLNLALKTIHRRAKLKTNNQGKHCLGKLKNQYAGLNMQKKWRHLVLVTEKHGRECVFMCTICTAVALALHYHMPAQWSLFVWAGHRLLGLISCRPCLFVWGSPSPGS